MFEERSIRANYVVPKVGYMIKKEDTLLTCLSLWYVLNSVFKIKYCMFVYIKN